MRGKIMTSNAIIKIQWPFIFAAKLQNYSEKESRKPVGFMRNMIISSVWLK